MANDPNKETTTKSGFWTTSQIAQYYKISTGRVRAILSDANLSPEDRQTGRGGEHVYRISTVKRVFKARPGQGTRTDLK